VSVAPVFRTLSCLFPILLMIVAMIVGTTQRLKTVRLAKKEKQTEKRTLGAYGLQQHVIV
jgi:hypothetical protein